VPARAELQKALALAEKLGDDPALKERAPSVRAEAQYWLAETYRAAADYDGAIREAAAVAPYNLEPWYSRSMLLMARASAEAGDLPAATRTVKLLLERFPKSAAADDARKLAAQYKLEL
jgi:TolA-binding protein